MSRDKSVWFAEEILLDAKLINYQLESGEWDAVEEMLRAEAQLSRDAETGRLRPKKASEYTLRLIAEVLHIMRLDVEQGSYNRATLAVAQQCLRLIRSCAAAGTKMQTYVSKDLGILDSMLALCLEHQQATSHPSSLPPLLLRQFDSCCIVLMQTLGNLVVNNPFNQILIWDKFDAVILNALVGGNDNIASAAAMIVYNILLGQPNVLPDDPLLLNSLADMYANGNTEYPHLIIEYLVGVENTYIEKLYAKLEPECRTLVLTLAYNILVSNQTQDINVSGNFVRFMAHEFKSKSDLILKTVDKYVTGVEPQEVVFLLDILATAAGMDAYLETLQSDASLFINCAFLLRAIHKLGKESNNFFSSINKLYEAVGFPVPETLAEQQNAPPPDANAADPQAIPLQKNDSADNVLYTAETTSECTESESSEQFYECSETPQTSATPSLHGMDEGTHVKSRRSTSADRTADAVSALKLEQDLVKVAFVKKLEGGEERWPGRKVSLEHKIDIDDGVDDGEPPLILDPLPVENSLDNSPDEPITEIHLKAPMVESPSEVSPPLTDPALDSIPHPVAAPTIAPEPKPVKKSQNLSTDFNLSEQLEKILGKSTKGETKEAIPEETQNVAAARPPPSVKIDSPDEHKSRLGEIDTTNTKRVLTNVCSVEQHVAFGFKASLVRLLGNLCWKHPHNKTLIRELEVIPVLLDCCNIDARNPLIMQWVIFAVRILCENCPENQEVISKLTLQSPVQTELLQEMGLSLHTDPSGRTLRVAPLKTV